MARAGCIRRGPGSSLRPRPSGVAAAILAAACLAGPAAAATVPDAAEVKVERVRPQREKHPTLRFLKENRDFIRARFDLLKEKPLESHGSAGEIDPRFLSYRDMLAKILAARDSVAVSEDARTRQELLASITQLGELEARLDLMDQLLAEQRGRLGVLQGDFTGSQQTALVVVVSGYPGEAAVSNVAITLEDGATLTVPLSPEQRESLRQGGVVQVFHGFVEPRAQVVEVALAGDRWPTGDSGFVTLDPARDRLTFLMLDLSTVRPDQGAATIRASTWLHDAKLHSGDG